jgi:hypothetical protein
MTNGGIMEEIAGQEDTEINDVAKRLPNKSQVVQNVSGEYLHNNNIKTRNSSF